MITIQRGKRGKGAQNSQKGYGFCIIFSGGNQVVCEQVSLLNIFALTNFTCLAIKTNFNISLLQKSKNTVSHSLGSSLASWSLNCSPGGRGHSTKFYTSEIRPVPCESSLNWCYWLVTSESNFQACKRSSLGEKPVYVLCATVNNVKMQRKLRYLSFPFFLFNSIICLIWNINTFWNDGDHESFGY